MAHFEGIWFAINDGLNTPAGVRGGRIISPACMPMKHVNRLSRMVFNGIRNYRTDMWEKEKVPMYTPGLCYELNTQKQILKSYLSSLDIYSNTVGYKNEISHRSKWKTLKGYRKQMTLLIREISKVLSNWCEFYGDIHLTTSTTTSDIVTTLPIVRALSSIYQPSYHTTVYVKKIIRKLYYTTGCGRKKKSKVTRNLSRKGGNGMKPRQKRKKCISQTKKQQKLLKKRGQRKIRHSKSKLRHSKSKLRHSKRMLKC